MWMIGRNLQLTQAQLEAGCSAARAGFSVRFSRGEAEHHALDVDRGGPR